jgi:hypothetical protein
MAHNLAESQFTGIVWYQGLVALFWLRGCRRLWAGSSSINATKELKCRSNRAISFGVYIAAPNGVKNWRHCKPPSKKASFILLLQETIAFK